METTQIEGYLSLDECRDNIKMLADAINGDISSVLVNEMRIESLRSLLNLFEEYNNQLDKGVSK